MGWESFDVNRFDLWPLLQGQMRIAKIKSAYNSSMYRKSSAKNLLMWSDFT